MTDALIHLRVPAEKKARWVRESRAEGKRLTDWIIEKIEDAAMNEKLYKVQIYDTRARKEDLFTQVVASNAIEAMEKAGKVKLRGEYTSIRRLDYWQEKNPESPELSASDNAHCQHNSTGTAGIAAWRVK